jgi:serine/threonine protein kinase
MTGDLQANILINSHQRAVLADFGLATILIDPGVSIANTTSSAIKGTIPWMAPELLYPERFGLTHCKLTKASDMYAFGMLILEVGRALSHTSNINKYWRQVLTGMQPFKGLLGVAILYQVVSGIRPERPANSYSIGLLDSVWKSMGRCWLQTAEHRPDASAVLKVLNEASRYWEAQLSAGSKGVLICPVKSIKPG